MAKALLIVNPSSGKEKGAKYKDMTKEVLEKRYEEVVVKETEKGGDATDFAFDAAKQGFDAVVAMGGDGTLNEVINGLAPHDNRPAFGFIPLGTVNDLARSLGIPRKPEKAIKALEKAVLKPMDLGKIEDSYFMNVVAAGMIAQAVDKVDVEQKTKFGSFAYFFEGVKAFNKGELLHFQVEHEAGKWEGEAAMVIIGLTNSVAGIETFASDAKVDDGYMHLFLLTKLNLLSTANMLPKLLSGKLENSEDVIYIKTKKVQVQADESDIVVNVDGDPGPSLPVHLEVLPSHLQVLVPKNS